MRLYSFFIIIVSIFLGSFILAQEAVVFPVAELGGCPSEEECRAYCDQPENYKVCNDWAEKQGLISDEEAEENRKMLDVIGDGGPGGCTDKDECELYCQNPDNIEECIVFGLENNLMPPEEREKAEMALQAIRQGVKPPACAGPKNCDVYCSEPEHLEECLEFGIAAGFIGPEEAEMARKTGGKGPGDCRGKQECDNYCSQPENMPACIEFGIEYNLIPEEELENAKKTLEAIKKGVIPPACQGQEECDIYCSQPEHAEECINFAIAAGFIPAEEAEMALKMAKAGVVGGPGGCRGKEECEAFCDNPDNQLECMRFAVENELMPPEQLENAKKMLELGLTGGPGGCKNEQECDAYCSVPENQKECFEFGVKMGFIPPEEAERMQKIQEIGPDNRGPGGCETPAQCEYMCSQPQYMEECMNYSVEQGIISINEAEAVMMMGPEGPGGPGGCQGQEGCEDYCSQAEHTEECINFSLEKGLISSEEAEKMRQMMSIEGMVPSFPTGPGEMLLPEGGMPPNEGFITPEGYVPPEGGIQPPPEGWVPPEGWTGPLPPSPEEQMFFQQPPEGQMPPEGQLLPPPTGEIMPPSSEQPLVPESPQSFFDIAKNLLASVVSKLGF